MKRYYQKFFLPKESKERHGRAIRVMTQVDGPRSSGVGRGSQGCDFRRYGILGGMGVVFRVLGTESWDGGGWDESKRERHGG